MKTEKQIISTEGLMKEIGWLVILLPWTAVLFTLMFPSSISTTFFTNHSWIFAGIMSIGAILLFNYRGYDLIDRIMTDIAGLCLLLIVWFPCTVDPTTNHICVGDYNGGVGVFLLPNNVTNIIHLISAFVLFAVLAFISIFLFRKTNGEITENKKKRNIIYLICGIGMVASFLIMLLPDFYIKVWLVECIALTFFGISWLTKANCYKWLFCD